MSSVMHRVNISVVRAFANTCYVKALFETSSVRAINEDLLCKGHSEYFIVNVSRQEIYVVQAIVKTRFIGAIYERFCVRPIGHVSVIDTIIKLFC